MSSTKVLLTCVNSTYAIDDKQLLCFTKLHHKVFSRRCRPINRKVPIEFNERTAVIVDEGEARINYNRIEIESE